MIKSILSSREIPSQPSLIFNAGGTWFDTVKNGGTDFFDYIEKIAQENGVNSYVVNSETSLAASLAKEKHLQLHVSQGPATSKALFVMPSYVWGFWYIDPAGTHWNSTVRQMNFNPDEIDAEAASHFFNGVAGYNIRENRSKFPQKKFSDNSSNQIQAAIFLQDIEKYRHPVHYLSGVKIIETVAKSASGNIAVKLHPAQSSHFRNLYLDACARFSNVIVTQESIHNIIPRSDIIVTQNSAVGFEALMYKKPVITCAQSDFHHATIVAKNTDELGEAFKAVSKKMRNFPYEKFFYWFLAEQMLEPQKTEFGERVWERIEKHFV